MRQSENQGMLKSEQEKTVIHSARVNGINHGWKFTGFAIYARLRRRKNAAHPRSASDAEAGSGIDLVPETE